MLRPAIANERLTLKRAGQVVPTLKTADGGGTTLIVVSPLVFMQRFAALVVRQWHARNACKIALADHFKSTEEYIPAFSGLSDFQYYAWITPWPKTSTNSQPV